MLKKILGRCIDHYTWTFLGITLVWMLFLIYAENTQWIEAFIRSFLLWSVGVRGLIAFMANWYPPFANEIAQKYGWPLGNSFQREIAASDAAFGVLGILSLFFGGEGFWTATLIGVAILWSLSEMGSLITIAQRKKKDPSYQLNQALHIGMRTDLILSVLIFVILALWKQN